MEKVADQPSTDGPASSRSRRAVPETGSFGKASTRKSRTRSFTPATAKVVKEDPTLAAADAIFASYFASRAAAPPDPSQRQRKASIPSSASQPNLLSNEPSDSNAGPKSRYIPKEPTEVVLRGFKATQQWAAIREYERIGGQICEDYPREPPPEQRKFKADMRDPAVLRKRALTPEEKAKAFRFAGGETWIKITFESAEAAEAAVDSSPQNILGYMVCAELYRGVPPTALDEAVPAQREQKRPDTPRSRNTLARSATTPNMGPRRRGIIDVSPPDSQASTRTIDSATMSSASTATASTATITGGPTNSTAPQAQPLKAIPTAKRIQLMPVEQALMPQQSYTQKFLAKIPLINWFTSDFFGSTLPKTVNGEFDWANASLYWRIIYIVDKFTGWYDIGDKDD